MLVVLLNKVWLHLRSLFLLYRHKRKFLLPALMLLQGFEVAEMEQVFPFQLIYISCDESHLSY